MTKPPWSYVKQFCCLSVRIWQSKSIYWLFAYDLDSCKVGYFWQTLCCNIWIIYSALSVLIQNTKKGVWTAPGALGNCCCVCKFEHSGWLHRSKWKVACRKGFVRPDSFYNARPSSWSSRANHNDFCVNLFCVNLFTYLLIYLFIYLFKLYLVYQDLRMAMLKINLISLNHLMTIHYSSHSINAVFVNTNFIIVEHLWTEHCSYLERFLNMLHDTYLIVIQCHSFTRRNTLQPHTVYTLSRIVWLKAKHITWCCYFHTVANMHAPFWA